MDLWDAMRARHSVRHYTDKTIEGDVRDQLQKMIDACNRESGLHIQLYADDPNAFGGMMSKYGGFKNVRNYIALVGKKTVDWEEKCGYYGEKVVLKAQQLGLNTCWVALTYSKSKCAAIINPEEKLLMVIAVGYGETQGIPHKGKDISTLCRVEGDMLEWFRSGMEAVQLAPTAINQQKFLFTLKNGIVNATALFGPNTKVDLGIAKCHFEIGAGDSGWQWA